MARSKGTLVVRFVGDINDLSQKSKQAKKQVRQVGEGLVDTGKKMSIGFTAPVLFGFKKAVDASSALNETVDANKVIFKENAEEAEAWGRTMAASAGLAADEALGARAAFGNMFKTVGLGIDESIDMSKVLVQLAGDMASFSDEDPSEMLLRLRSGLSGEAEPLRRFGVLISAARVEAKAMEMGLADANGEISESAKVQARYAVILEDTAVQQKNFALTADSVANKERAAGAEARNAAASFGQVLEPVYKRMVDTTRVLVGWFEHMPGTVKTGVAALLGIGAVVGPVLLVVGKIRILRAQLKLLEQQGAGIGVGFGKLGGLANRLGITTRAVGGAVAAAAIGMQAYNLAQQQASENASDMAKSLASETIPELLRTGKGLRATAHDTEYLSGLFGDLFGSGNRKAMAAIFKDLRAGSISTGVALKRLADQAGMSSDELHGMVSEQVDAALAQSQLLGKVKEFGQVAFHAYDLGQLTAEELVVKLRAAGLEQGALNRLIAAIPDAGLREQVRGVLEFAKAQEKAAAQTSETGKAIHEFAGMTAEEFKSWKDDTIGNIAGVQDIFSELADDAHLTADEIIGAFRGKLTALDDYEGNWKTLLKRGIPDELAKQLQEMGLEGAGWVEALANANVKDFKRIMRQMELLEAKSKRIGGELPKHWPKGINIPLSLSVRQDTVFFKGSKIGVMHHGGVFRAQTPGGEGLALLRDRERVLTPEQDRARSISLPAGRGVNNFSVTINVDARGRDTPNAIAEMTVEKLERLVRGIAMEEDGEQQEHEARLARMRLS